MKLNLPYIMARNKITGNVDVIDTETRKLVSSHKTHDEAESAIVRLMMRRTPAVANSDANPE